MRTNKYTILLALAIAAVLTYAPGAFALTYGNNITISDGEQGPGYIGTSTSQGREDNEAEQGMVQSQVWDLEGVFRKGNVLTMIGGFDFKIGVSGYPTYTSGDIFISTDATYGTPVASFGGNGFNNVANTFGYEYALHIDWSNLSFSAFKLDATDTTTTVYYTGNETGAATSNPWKYVSGGTQIGTGTGTGGGLISNTIANGEYGLQGMNSNINHYAVSFDLSSVFADANLYGKDFYTHFTMGCGNDNLIGHDTAPVPEPGTMMLLGFGMLGLAVYGKRRMNKDA